MIQLVLSIGSNIDRTKHITFAVCELKRLFGALLISPVYETLAVGFNGPDFYNLVVAMESDIAFDDLLNRVREIEKKAGRVRGEKVFSSRHLDIDVLLYGEQNLRKQGINVPRDEIDHAAYVLGPLAELLPDKAHPVSGQTFAQMWQVLKNTQQGKEREFSRIELDFSCAE